MNEVTARKTIRVRFMWVPHELGGHSRGPWVGMRWGLRWQRPDEQRDFIRYDVQCLRLSSEPASGIWTGDFGFGIGSSVSEDWLRSGERIEFLGAYEVYAVGVIEGLLPGSA